MRFMVVLVFAALLTTPQSFAAPGDGFGESIWTLSSARQAATGGVPVEESLRQGTLVEASSISLVGAGMQWVQAGVNLGGGRNPGVQLEAFGFFPGDSLGTTEDGNGGYGGTAGDVEALEAGGRATGRIPVWRGDSVTLRAVGRVIGLWQGLPDRRTGGMGAEVGMEMDLRVGSGAALTGWAAGGPVGRGAGRAFGRHGVMGGGYVSQQESGWIGRPYGFGLGVEAELLTEDSAHLGAGAVAWLGRPRDEGLTWFLRGGVRSVPSGSRTIQPRAGAGVAWRTSSGWGMQLDWAAVPLGVLGWNNTLTASVRIPPRQHPSSPPSVAPPPSAPVQPVPLPPMSSVPLPGTPVPRTEETIYFSPGRGERAKVSIVVRMESVLSAKLVDLEGRILRILSEARPVTPGTYEIEWDGELSTGVPAPLEQAFLIRVGHDGETMMFRVVAREFR
jgi:hypothetical protein